MKYKKRISELFISGSNHVPATHLLAGFGFFGVVSDQILKCDPVSSELPVRFSVTELLSVS